MGKLVCEKNLRDVWCRNESVRAEIGPILQTHTHTHTRTHAHTHTHTHTHTHARARVSYSRLKVSRQSARYDMLMLTCWSSRETIFVLKVTALSHKQGHVFGTLRLLRRMPQRVKTAARIAAFSL